MQDLEDINDEYSAVLMEIGAALVWWGRIERSLCDIFLDCLMGADHTSGSAVFYSVINLKTKLDLIEAAIKFRTEDREVLDGWTKLSRKVRESSSHRQPIAHCNIVHFPQAARGDRVVLTASPLDPVRWGRSRPLNLKMIKDRTKAFAALAKRVDDFFKKLRKLPQPPDSRALARGTHILPDSLKQSLKKRS